MLAAILVLAWFVLCGVSAGIWFRITSRLGPDELVDFLRQKGLRNRVHASLGMGAVPATLLCGGFLAGALAMLGKEVGAGHSGVSSLAFTSFVLVAGGVALGLAEILVGRPRSLRYRRYRDPHVRDDVIARVTAP